MAFLRYSLVLLGLGEVSCPLWTAETECTACLSFLSSVHFCFLPVAAGKPSQWGSD